MCCAPGEQARRELLVSLASAVANGQERSEHSECAPYCPLSPSLAYLIALSNSSLTCDDVSSALEGTRTLPSHAPPSARTLPCSWLTLPPTAVKRAASPGCEPAPPLLLTAGIYLFSIEQAPIDHASLAAFASNAAAGAHANRTDMASGSASATASHFRFMMDKLALAIGLRRVLYLDTDAVVARPSPSSLSLLPLFDAATTHPKIPLIVAKRSHYVRDARWNPWNTADPQVLAVLRARFGFDASVLCGRPTHDLAAMSH